MRSSLLMMIDEILATAFVSCGLSTDTAHATRSSRLDLADFQCNGTMRLGKLLQRDPRKIAQDIANKLREFTEFAEVSVTGPGFLNLRLADQFLIAHAINQGQSEDLGVLCQPRETVMLDFGGPNVAKPLHVGHLRSLVIGESLRRIFEIQGLHTISDIHLGDWGLQMGMLITEIRRSWPNLAPGTLPDLQMEDLQQLYTAASAACGASGARLEEARAATAALQKGDPDTVAVWEKLREMSLAAQLSDIARIGAHFDLLLGESDAQPLIPALIVDLTERGLAQLNNGALVVEISKEGDNKLLPPLLLTKSDGASLYATTDLATLVQRQQRFRPSKIFYIVDQRQSLHFEQVFRAARLAGLVEGMDLIHVGFGTVNGPDGKPYKTRDGSVAQLSDLLNEAIAKARERISNADHADADELAKMVGLAAVKFADLSSFRTSGYVFDADRLVSFEGRTGPYVQYATVRIGAILNRAHANGAYPGDIIIGSAIERALILECLQFPEAVASASRNLAPNEITDYVFSLAQLFSKFYTKCPVLTAEQESERASRLALCELVGKILRKGLWLLGISIPERM